MKKFEFRTKTVLVTGGAGSIGRAIVKKALSEGSEKVIACDTDEIRLFELYKDINDMRFGTYIMDIKDTKSVERTFSFIGHIDIVFHAAAMKHVPVCEDNPIEAVLTNIIGTQNIIDAALRWNVPNAVMICTDKAVNPKNVMGASKFIAEKIFLRAAEKSSKNYFAVRFGNVANSRGSVIPVLLQMLSQKNEIMITDSEVTRFIMRIDDAVTLIFKSLDISVGGEIFVLKMPAFKLGDLADILVTDVASILTMPANSVKVKTVGLVKGEKKHEELFDGCEEGGVMDLGIFYGIVDISRFPSHQKYSKFSVAKDIPPTSKEALRISRADLKHIVLENFVSPKNRVEFNSVLVSHGNVSKISDYHE